MKSDTSRFVGEGLALALFDLLSEIPEEKKAGINKAGKVSHFSLLQNTSLGIFGVPLRLINSHNPLNVPDG